MLEWLFVLLYLLIGYTFVYRPYLYKQFDEGEFGVALWASFIWPLLAIIVFYLKFKKQW